MFGVIKDIGLGLMVLLPLVNPLTTIALFLSLSKNMKKEERDYHSIMTSIYVFFIMMVTFYAGSLVMSTFGISIPGLRIAGGLIVSFIGFRMLFPYLQEDDVKSNSENCNVNIKKKSNIAFVPLAIPSTAGPGTIAMIISWVSTVNESTYFSYWASHIVPIIVFLIISVIIWISLKSSNAIMHVIGLDGVEVISRLMGFLLVCMGIQFIINGILEIINNKIF
ncbi:MAG: MarC family NAAT transporter [Enterobacteriaceae bacterium]